ncbi:MAG: GDSL-type esterase/lipase family protein [Cyclobacteriaceae bacterium]
MKSSPSFLFILVVSAVGLLSCETPAPSTEQIDPTSNLIKYHGRINWADSLQPEFYWPGSGLSINYQGGELYADYYDANGEVYLNIIYDQDSLRYLKLESGENKILLADFEDKEVHRIDVLKRNEWMVTGPLNFKGLTLADGKLLAPPQSSGKVIEFFGNSITAGFAIEDLTGGDRWDSIYTNNYYTYAANTARHFNADYYATVQSGVGITVSWNPEIMPEIYNLLNPKDSTSLWDFSKVQPDVVVINLGQNDSWLLNMPEFEQFIIRFGENAPTIPEWQAAYRSFIQSIRDVYPSAHIVCAIGSMDASADDSPWPGYIQESVNELADGNMSTIVFPFMETNGHPRVAHNRKMAAQLITHLEEVMGW